MGALRSFMIYKYTNHPVVVQFILLREKHVPVVSGGDGAEPFLTRRIPNLQLDLLPVQFDGSDFEVDADGGNEGGVEGVLGEPEQDAGLSHPWIADQQQFEQIVVRLGHDAAVQSLTFYTPLMRMNSVCHFESV